MPLPTTMTWAGSCPDPEPWTIDTLLSFGCVGPHDQVVLGHVLQGVRVGQRDALEHLRDELLRVVDELLHDAPSTVLWVGRCCRSVSDCCSAGGPMLAIFSAMMASAMAPASTESDAALAGVAARPRLPPACLVASAASAWWRRPLLRSRRRLARDQRLFDGVGRRDQGVQQGLLAEHGLAPGVDALGRGAQHRHHVLAPERLRVARRHARPAGRRCPRSGPDVPPIREVMTMAIFFRKVPMSCGRSCPSRGGRSRSRGPANSRNRRRRPRHRGRRIPSRCPPRSARWCGRRNRPGVGTCSVMGSLRWSRSAGIMAATRMQSTRSSSVTNSPAERRRGSASTTIGSPVRVTQARDTTSAAPSKSSSSGVG